jgi:hypothetical protein
MEPEGSLPLEMLATLNLRGRALVNYSVLDYVATIASLDTLGTQKTFLSLPGIEQLYLGCPYHSYGVIKKSLCT